MFSKGNRDAILGMTVVILFALIFWAGALGIALISDLPTNILRLVWWSVLVICPLIFFTSLWIVNKNSENSVLYWIAGYVGFAAFLLWWGMILSPLFSR